MTPTREGWYHWEGDTDLDIYDVEVYEGPNGDLCVWCDDIGAGGYEPIFTEGDEMCGHIPVCYLDGKWTFLKPF